MLVAVVILLIGGLFYFNLQKNSTDKISFENKEKCAELGQIYIQQAGSISNEQHTYNSVLNTCLVYFEEVTPGAHYFFIVDSLTNEALYTHLVYRGDLTNTTSQELWNQNCAIENGCFIDKNDFDNKFNELFI